MARSAFIISSAIHAGLIALACFAATHEKTGRGAGESGLVRTEDAGAQGELFVAADMDEPVSGETRTVVSPEYQPASAPAPEMSLAIGQTLMPMTTAISFTLAVAPTSIALPSFVPDAVGSGNEPTKTKARTTSTKGGGSRSRSGMGGGQAYTPARYTFCPPPAFPAEARKSRLSGTVLLLVQVDERGRPSSVTLRRTSGHAILDTAALRAVRAWRFEPARRDGQPIGANLEIPVRFALS